MTKASHQEYESERLLALALEQPPQERVGFLSAACGSDADLRRELFTLLPYAEGDPRFLLSPVLRPVTPDVLAFLEAQACGRSATEANGIPEQIGGYRIERLLGYGGMGLIYEATESDTERSVALKIQYPWPASPELVRRFASEAHILANLECPGVPKIYEIGFEKMSDPLGRTYRLPFLVMELVQGELLDSYMVRSQFALTDRLRLFVRICEAVHQAHLHGVVHRDLKPANILIREDGQPKILDFGIATCDGSTPVTSAGQVLGTLAYMSPELLAGHPERADARADVYSLGVILYELLAGRLPFEINNLSVAGAAVLIAGTSAASLGSLNRSLRGDLASVVSKAMQKDLQRRYSTAAEFAADIDRFLCGKPVLARSGSFWSRVHQHLFRDRTSHLGALGAPLG